MVDLLTEKSGPGKTDETMVLVLFSALPSPPPETVTVLVSNGAALEATVKPMVIGG